MKLELFTKKILALPKRMRQLMLFSFDFLSLTFSFFISSLINYQDINLKNFPINYLIGFILTNSIIYIYTGQYKSLTQFNTLKGYLQIFMRVFFSSLIFYYFIKRNSLSINFFINFTLISSFALILLRVLLSSIINFKFFKNRKNIIIYGAGNAGAKLARSISIDKANRIICFIDDNSALWGRSIFGYEIKSPEYLKTLEKDIDCVLFCIPSIKNIEKKRILNFLNKFSFKVFKVPTIEEIKTGKAKISEFRNINIEDLIYRDSNAKIEKLTKDLLLGKNIFITGAGGSIGSELTRQIINLEPKKIILLEISEINLYLINKEISKFANKKIEVIATLGSASDYELVNNILKENDINYLIHAAAYKHVYLVEKNPLAGLSNNILSTIVISKLSRKYKVDGCILISTDKAVRPKNIMGASKRISEIIFNVCQNISNHNNSNTKFSIVRFGNVLGSSGSVVPLFKQQIKDGGPLTVTHPEVIRYFMTIEEAVNLVINTIAISKGGETFILDMGEPVKILDLAKKMIKLSGLKLKDKKHTSGDIEIKFLGLKEGEKLYEELLIRGKSKPTIFEQIQEDIDPTNYQDPKLIELLNQLEKYLIEKNLIESINIMSTILPEWSKSQNIIDLTK